MEYRIIRSYKMDGYFEYAVFDNDGGMTKVNHTVLLECAEFDEGKSTHLYLEYAVFDNDGDMIKVNLRIFI